MARGADATPWWRRKWVTVGEVVGVAALVVAALGYWDSHRDRRAARAERASAAREAVRREALVLTATAEDGGARLLLAPLRSGQAVQTQRYVFPTPVLGHAMEVTAAQPQIDRAWFEAELKAALDAAAKAQGEPLKPGEGTLPVVIATSFIEDGETRSDATLYRLGYRLEAGGLFGGKRITLQGLSLVRHGVGSDARAVADTAWRNASARPLAPDAA